MILAGDIGGTKTHLALFETNAELKCAAQKKYVSHQYGNLSKIVSLFLEEHQVRVERACFGIAGPVSEGRCLATNLPWVVDAQDLAQELQTSFVWLINDLEAIGYGIPCLQQEEFYSLNKGKDKGVGNAALIAAGTGLGESGLYWDGAGHRPFACEGGHADFAPRNDLEIELWKHLHKKFGHVSFERVVSGPGIYALYRFLVDTGIEKEADFIAERLTKIDNPKVITDAALKKECKVCERAVDWFISLYGSEAGNLALKLLAVGGIYVGGGIAPKILKAMQSDIFFNAFVDKGRFRSFLSEIPVKVILNDNAGLLGAARYVGLQR